MMEEHDYIVTYSDADKNYVAEQQYYATLEAVLETVYSNFQYLPEGVAQITIMLKV